MSLKAPRDFWIDYSFANYLFLFNNYAFCRFLDASQQSRVKRDYFIRFTNALDDNLKKELN